MKYLDEEHINNKLELQILGLSLTEDGWNVELPESYPGGIEARWDEDHWYISHNYLMSREEQEELEQYLVDYTESYLGHYDESEMPNWVESFRHWEAA